MTVLFEILAQNYPNKTSFVPNLGIFLLLCKILQLDKLEGPDFKDDNNVLKFQQKSICPNFRHFQFFMRFCNETNFRVLISNMTQIF